MLSTLHMPHRYVADLDRMAHQENSQMMGDFFVLGGGVQGKVLAAKRSDNGERVAIKRMDLHTYTEENYKQLRREWNTCRVVSHPQIVEFKEAFYGGPREQPEAFYMVFERMDFTLAEYYKTLLRNDKDDPLHTAKSRKHMHVVLILVQLLKALEYLETLGIIHRDIKPANVGFVPSGFVVKLLDFGLSRREDSRPPQFRDLTKISGSPLYAAPEIHAATGQYNSKVDIWSVAVLVTEMLGVFITNCDLSKLPVDPTQRMLSNCVLDRIIELRGMPSDKHGPIFGDRFADHDRSQGQRLRDILPLNRLEDDLQQGLTKANFLDLIDRMLTVNPLRRPSAAGCLKHPYIEGVNTRFEQTYMDRRRQLHDAERNKFIADAQLLCECVEENEGRA